MKERSVVLVEFTGKEAATGRVFDTTSEKVAKENGFFRENAVFGHMPVIVGNGDLLPGLDSALKLMDEGIGKYNLAHFIECSNRSGFLYKQLQKISFAWS